MILAAPNLETLLVAMKAGFVPPELAAKPALVSQADGQIAIEFKGKLTKKQKAELTAIGMAEANRHLGDVRTVATWLQIVPVTNSTSLPTLTAQTPILFDIRDPSLLGDVVREMIRLGNDRQSYRWLEHDDGRTSVLLRVVNPPYYSLLRAIDRLDGDLVAAYREAVPGVWVQIGSDHPFADSIRPASGQSILIPASDDWIVLPESPFRDIYELLSISLPGEPVAWSESTVDRTVTVPLRLVPAAATAAAEWWVFAESGFDEIDAFVRDADERLIRKLRFAVGRSADGQETIVLRAAVSKEAPPAINLPSSVAYAPYWKLPNLLLPIGKALHPPLRRETVRANLADDPSQCIWLDAEADGEFTPRSIAESAFRPLDEWVEYVIERHREPIAEWIAATGFDWDSFRVGTPSAPVDKPPKRERGDKANRGPQGPSSAPAEPAKSTNAETLTEPPSFIAPAERNRRTPSEWQLKRAALEKQFLDSSGESLDDPVRRPLWAPLAVCYAGTGEFDNLAAATMQAIDHDPDQIAEYGAVWATAEWKTATLDSSALTDPLDDEPTTANLRRRMSLLSAFARDPATKMQRRAAYDDLVRFEHRLPVRMAWILLREAATDRGGDDLATTRGRDRLFARLYETGLNPERDLVSFLRYAGLQESERGRVVLEKAQQLSETIRNWTEQSLAAAKPDYDRRNTLALMELVFTWAFARLQNNETSKRFERQAGRRFQQADERANASAVASFQSLGIPWIRDAFRVRIEQAQNAESDRGSLPTTLQNRFRELAPSSDKNRPTLSQADHFGLARLRTESAILEPVERLEPYDSVLQYDTDLKTALVRTAANADSSTMARETNRLLASRRGDPSKRDELFRILHRMIPMSPRVGEAFAEDMIGLIPAALPTEAMTLDRAERMGELFDRAIRVAVYFDRLSSVQTLLQHVASSIRSAPTPDTKARLLESLGVAPLLLIRSTDVVAAFLETAQSVLFGGLPLDRVLVTYVGKSPNAWVDFLKATMVLAAGWEVIHRADRASDLFGLVERELTAPSTKIESLAFAKLMVSFIRACGAASPEVGLSRVDQLVRAVPPGRLLNAYSTNTLYSRLHLLVAEAVALAITSDLSAGSLSGRRWRDEEEYLVRQRITSDVRRMTG